MKSKTSSTPEYWSELLNSIETNVDAVTGPIIVALETLNPDDRFGKMKQEHMKKIASQTDRLAWESWIEDKNDKFLLHLVLRFHDIGRFVEGLAQADNNSELLWKYKGTKIDHNQVGAELLESSWALETLTAEDKETVLGAIRNHGVWTVNLPEDSLAYKLCYILRDIDKQEALEDSSYMNNKWALIQIEKRFLSSAWKETLIEKKDDHAVIEYIHETISKLLRTTYQSSESFFKEGGGDEFERENDIQWLMDEIRNILSQSVDQETLNDFLSGKLCNQKGWKKEWWSYATYMLYTLAFFFDIKNTHLLQELIKDETVKKRLLFIFKKFPKDQEATFTSIVEVLNEYIKSKDPNYKKNKDLTEAELVAALKNEIPLLRVKSLQHKVD